jgi:hypothetical protein
MGGSDDLNETRDTISAIKERKIKFLKTQEKKLRSTLLAQLHSKQSSNSKI